MGEIVNVSVSEEFLDEKGKVDVKRMRPITYDPINHEYLVLGEKAGNAFKDGLTI